MIISTKTFQIPVIRGERTQSESLRGRESEREREREREMSNQHIAVRLMKRPVGMIVPGVDLVARSETRPSENDVGDGDVLLHRLYLSLDPAMRGWMNDIPSYVPPVKIGAIMRGGSVNEVVYSRNPKFKVGDVVMDNGMNEGWSEYAISSGKALERIQVDLERLGLPLSACLGVLGGTGLTAYFGFLRVGRPKRGEVVLVRCSLSLSFSLFKLKKFQPIIQYVGFWCCRCNRFGSVPNCKDLRM